MNGQNISYCFTNYKITAFTNYSIDTMTYTEPLKRPR